MRSHHERGSALVIALLVTFILSLLGVSFLLMGQTESRIAANERNALQAFYLAEAGSSLVQSWFDRPGSALHFPAPEVVRRSQREVLDETDPYEGTPTAGTQYKEIAASSTDVDLDGDGLVDLFRPPYRGGVGVEHALLGTESAPDLVIDDADLDPAMGAYLIELSRDMFGPELAGPGRRGRISRIAIYAPPYVPSSGNWTRYGIATVEVTARIYRLDEDRVETGVLAERTVKTVLNEIPYGTPVFGPLHACGDLEFSGHLNAHWGSVTTGGNLDGYLPGAPNIDDSVPRSVPPGPRLDSLWVDQGGKENCVLEYNSRAHGEVVADPWLRVVARNEIVVVPPLSDDQPWKTPAPYFPDSPPACDPVRTDDLDCCDHSNLIQAHPLVSCPEYDYDFWKSIAGSGRSDVHYFTYDSAGLFLESGVDTPVSFQDATNGKRGLFFFDTEDSLAPHDDDLNGVPDNLTPAVTVSTNWQASGFIYLNAEEFGINGPLTPPQDVLVRAPGEPYLDANNNREFDAGEAWVNLEYPKVAGDTFKISKDNDDADDGASSGTGAVRNTASPFEIDMPVSFSGIIYTSGNVTASGSGAFYGSIIARGAITLGEAGDSPDFYWDERIVRRWPPLAEVGLPRVVATRWHSVP